MVRYFCFFVAMTVLLQVNSNLRADNNSELDQLWNAIGLKINETSKDQLKPTTPLTPKKQFSSALKRLSYLPIQEGGRIKPLEAFAQNSILRLIGKSSFKGWSPVEFLISLGAYREVWRKEKFLKIERPDFKRQIAIDESRLLYSPEEIVSNATVLQYLSLDDKGALMQVAPIPKVSRPDPRKQALYKLMDQLSLLGALESGLAWTVRPSVSVEVPWGHLMPAPGIPPEDDYMKAYLGSLLSYYLDDAKSMEAFVTILENKLQAAALETNAWSQTKLKIETLYLKTHPLMWAWILYLLAVLSWALVGVNAKFKYFAMSSFVAGFGIQIIGMISRSYVAGRPPVTNMYESIVWVSFGTILFAWILYYKHRKTGVLLTAGVLSILALILSDAAPAVIDPGIHELVPVLRSNYWLTIHVLTITISYAAFALAMGLGNGVLFRYLRGDPKVPSKLLELKSQLGQMYKALQFGVVLLALGTILGGVWADYSWGRFWGWDPKEVWALIALLGYLVILHARYTGWMRDFGFAAWTVIAFALVVMAWYGVNFVLGVGLHSYGFSQGGQGTVAFLTLAQVSFVLWVTYKVRVSR